MVYSLTWLPAVLETAGLKVAPVDGWEGRGRGDVGIICGVLPKPEPRPQGVGRERMGSRVDNSAMIAGA